MQIPDYSQLKRLYKQLTPTEFAVVVLAALLMIVGVLGLLHQLQLAVSTTVPVQDGRISEGIVGFPRYINPVIASANADQDVTALVYAGLTKLTTSGEIELDLAGDLVTSTDGSIYTFTIRDDATFHDGHPVTAEDVVYTVNMLQDQRVGSPLTADWSGVSVRATDDQTVVFELNEPFRDFLYNTRVGILPKHLWINETADTFPFSPLNTNPVGAGPYQVVDIDRNDEGLPTQYELTNFADYHNQPFIAEIKLNFFTSSAEREEAFENGRIDSIYGLDPETVGRFDIEQLATAPLTRIFAIFLNQNNNEAFVDTRVREALAVTIDKDTLINEVLNGYASPISGPLPTDVATNEAVTADERTAQARTLLETAGWSGSEVLTNSAGEQLTITLTTADIPSLRKTANFVAESWRDLGIVVNVTTLPTSDLSQEVIRPRTYEALLFGQLINQGRDLYPFWHSSELDDPGLNLALYANSTVDSLLEQYRQATSSTAQTRLAEEASEVIVTEQPAIFLYSPHFLYAVPENLKLTLPPIGVPADRFARIESWYSKTINVWNAFAPEEPAVASSPEASTTAATSTDQ